MDRRDITPVWSWKYRLKAGIFNQLPILLLIQSGADLVAKNEAGLTPLMYALKLGSKNHRNIKDIINCSKPEELDAVDKKGCTALHRVAIKMKDENPGFLQMVTEVRQIYLYLYACISYI